MHNHTHPCVHTHALAQTFGGTAISEDSRWHFDYFFPGMLTVFGIFTGGWVDAFQVCTHAYTHTRIRMRAQGLRACT